MSKISPLSSIDRAVLLLGVVLLASFLSPATAAAEPAELSDVAETVLENEDYQTTWPSDNDEAGIRAPIFFGQIAMLLMYVGFAVVVVLLIIWLVREFGGFGVEAGAVRDDGTVAGSDSDRRYSLAVPERLAREGRYAEAIHQLLLVTIWRLGRDLDHPPSPATTSRELSRSLPLDGSGREAFEFIVRRVELSLFGGHDVDARDYDSCRERYARLVPDSDV